MNPRIRTIARPVLPLGALLATAMLSRPSAATIPDECAALGRALIQHSCFHAQHGPFVDVLAGAGEQPAAHTPNVDNVHTHYSVTVGPDNVSVTYTPKRPGSWVIFGSPDIEPQLRDVHGADVVPLMVEDVTDACPGLPQAQLYVLDAHARYTLVYTASVLSTTPLVIENLHDFDTEYGFDLDGDGFGGMENTVFTPCTPPPGMIANVRDCNDEDPEINPDATEICDGVDENCNGLIDDVTKAEDACDPEDAVSEGCRCSPSGTSTRAFALSALFALFAGARIRRRQASRRR
ncbi:MAG: hypothetical protein B7733_14745 [Myxococcales bacterium FL481]|nr:MAG: hypothetical protein B7733_14745 [Myxococcales bacterium FL481]